MSKIFEKKNLEPTVCFLKKTNKTVKLNQLHRIVATGDSTENSRNIESISASGDSHVAVAEHFAQEDGEDGRRQLMSNTVGSFQS